VGNIAVHKFRELPSDARQIVERILGRALEPDEEVSIMAFAPHSAPTRESRKRLARQLEDRIARTAKGAVEIPETEQEAAIEEAIQNVRAHPQ
jgi:hypothetical protein